jgi:phosphoribosylformylglycinamidine synthase PurS subunit
MEYRARVAVVHRPGILDPQGAAIERALPAIGHGGVTRVSVGKVIRLTVEAPDSETARARVEEMCEQLLANPVIEDYAVTVEGSDLIGGPRR